jgi:hypothetical protein
MGSVLTLKVMNTAKDKTSKKDFITIFDVALFATSKNYDVANSAMSELLKKKKQISYFFV